MPEDTLFARDRIPPERWQRCLATAAMLTFSIVAAGEWLLRAKGYEPCVRDDNSLWALNFASAIQDRSSPLLLGSSRILCDLQLDAFAETFGHKPHQLGIVASSPLPILHYLAEDTDFRGNIVCEVSPEFFYDDSSEAWGLPLSSLDAYENMQASLFDAAEKRAEILFQEHLVLLSSQIQIEDICLAIVTSQWPVVTTHVTPDRNRAAFKNGGKKVESKEAIPDESAPTHFSPNDERLVNQVVRDVRKIRLKGGNVVFIYLPCTGPNLANERINYPRSTFWNGLLERTGCVGIRSDEDPELHDFAPFYDFSHLSVYDAEVFSRILGGKLRKIVPIQ